MCCVTGGSDNLNVMFVVKKYLRMLWLEITYLVVALLFMVRLSALNSILLAAQAEGASNIDLLKQNNWQAVRYFGITVLLFIIGIVCIYMVIKKVQLRYIECQEMLIRLLSIVCIILTEILLIKLIYIPILQAILSTVGLVSFMGYMIGEKVE